MKTLTTFILVSILISCSQLKKEEPTNELIVSTDGSIDQKVISLLGKPLPPKVFADSIKQVLDNNLSIAKKRLDVNPDSLDLIIWHGRRTAYLGRYFEAIDIYTKGLERFPYSYRLLRHRGHRYISTRQLDKAIADLKRANELSLNAPNAIEPDGIPNRLNKPLGNDKFNIYYHLGLSYYLKGEFKKAIPVYLQCMEVSDNDDLLAATSYWLHMTYYRTGNVNEAETLLVDINSQMEIIENEAYFELLSLFNGAELKMPQHPTYQYGLGMSHFLKGNKQKANQIWSSTVENSIHSWDSFGYIAAESELTSEP